MKIGIIGTGKQGNRFIETISKLYPDTKLVVSNTRGDHPGFKCFKDWRDMLHANLDGLVVAANPELNPAILQYANLMGVPVLLEKPAGLTLFDVRKMEKFRIPILVNYVHLFDPDYIELKSKLKNIKQVVSIGYNQGPNRSFSSLYDYAPHDISMCFDLLDRPLYVESQKVNKKNGGFLYKFELNDGNNIVANILCGNGGAERVRKLAVFCEGYNYSLTPNRENYRLPLINVVKHFMDVIGGAPVQVPISLTVSIHEVLHKLGINYAN